MRAFLTGATGFIGGALARALLADGGEVTALVRNPSKAGALERLGARIVHGDVTDPAVLARTMGGHDAIFHFAAVYAFGPGDRGAMLRTNVDGTRAVLRAAAGAGVERVVACSSSTVLGRTTTGGAIDETMPHDGSFASYYEETKMRAYRVAHDEGSAVVVMPAAVYGPGDTSLMGTMMRLWATRKLLAAPFLGVGASFVHVDDVARGSIAAAQGGKAGEDYLLGGDNETIGGAFKRAGVVLGIRPPLLDLPIGLVRWTLPVVARAIGHSPAALREAMTTLSSDLIYSSEKARHDLGYRFRPIEEGFAACVASIRG